MEQINEFYSKLLTSLGFSVEGDRVVITDEDGDKEVTVDDRVLTLPTNGFLSNPDWNKQVAFHPLCENTLRGESEVQKELTLMVRGALNVRLITLIWRLTKLAGAGVDNKLTPDQAEFLPSLVGFDKTMITNFGKLIKALDLSSYKTSLIHLNLNRRYKLGDTQYDRVCLVRFPLSESDHKEKPYSVLRVKDYDALRGLLSYILPDWEVENAYSQGTNSKVAPYFTALLWAYHGINKRLTELAKRFAPDFPEFEGLVNEDTWLPFMSDLAKLRDLLPSLEGNEGSIPKGGAGEEVTTAKPVPTPRAMEVPIAAPAAQVDVPWNAQPAAPAAQAPAPRQDEEAVAFVPRSRQQPPAGLYPGVQPAAPVQIPAGYAQPAHVAGSGPGGQPSFHQLAQMRAQQQHGYTVARPTLPPVGGSPFSGEQRPSEQTSSYQVAYVQPAVNPKPTGRGF